jgi:ligand-binding sensor domain-containing protein
MAVSKDNTLWVGFSRRIVFDLDTCGDRDEYDEEQGVYRYDGKWWMHFTTEDGLVDNKICAITIDANDNVYVGSYDKGVSRFDGHTWTSYVVP